MGGGPPNRLEFLLADPPPPLFWWVGKPKTTSRGYSESLHVGLLFYWAPFSGLQRESNMKTTILGSPNKRHSEFTIAIVVT